MILIVIITIPFPRVSSSADADAFYWSMKWSLRCLPVNRRPIKRRLLSWQLPGEQTTDVRARMIAWSEDTWWEAAPVLHSQPVWDGGSVRSKVGGVVGGLARQTGDRRRTCVPSWLTDRIFAPFFFKACQIIIFFYQDFICCRPAQPVLNILVWKLEQNNWLIKFTRMNYSIVSSVSLMLMISSTIAFHAHASCVETGRYFSHTSFSI